MKVISYALIAIIIVAVILNLSFPPLHDVLYRIQKLPPYAKMENGSIVIEPGYVDQWKKHIKMNVTSKYQSKNKFAWLILSSIILYMVYQLGKQYSPKVSQVCLFVGAIILLIKILPYKQWYQLDQFLHQKLIRIPDTIKCAFHINCRSKQCSKQNLNNWESQQHADIDFYGMGHIIMWAVIGYLEPRLRWQHVFYLSIIWEIVEALLGCIGLPFHGRITDVIINLTGYIIGSNLKT